MCAAPSAFVCIEINAIRNMELFLCCFKHTAIILHISVYIYMKYLYAGHITYALSDINEPDINYPQISYYN